MRTRFDDENCSVARALEVLGDWWTLLVVREAFLGTRRFADFEAAPQDDTLTQQRLAAARTALAEHLTAHPVAPDDAALAASLRQRAEQWYRDAGPGYAWRLGAR